MQPVRLNDEKEGAKMMAELADLGCAVYAPNTKTNSGLVVDRYMDGRKVFGRAESRAVVEKPILRNVDNDIETVVALGVDGLMMATVIAHARNLDIAAVRKEAKDHGMKDVVTGHYKSGSKALLVDGTMSSGTTMLEAQAKIQKYTDLEMNDALVLLNRSMQYQSWMNTAGKVRGKVGYFMDNHDLYALPRNRLLTKSSPAR